MVAGHPFVEAYDNGDSDFDGGNNDDDDNKKVAAPGEPLHRPPLFPGAPVPSVLRVLPCVRTVGGWRVK